MAGTWGHRVTVRFSDGTEVSGWIYGETADGTYVALDRAGKEIRFIPNGLRASFSYSYDDPATFQAHAQIPADAHISDGRFTKEVSDALDRVHYLRVRRIFEDMRGDANRFRGPLERLSYSGDSPERKLEQIVRRRYIALLREIQRVGLDQVLQEHAKELFELSAHGALPDLDLLLLDDRFRVIELIQQLPRTGNQLSQSALDADVVKAQTQIPTTTPDAKVLAKKRKGSRFKKIAAIGKVAIGGAFAAGNVAAGAFAGIVTALPTLGIGTVAGAVGVMTSIYTGLNAATDGVKEWGAAIETEP